MIFSKNNPLGGIMKEKSLKKTGIFLKVLIACILAVGMGGFGVALALSNVHVAFSGTFYFNGTEVSARVTIEAYQVSNEDSSKIYSGSSNLSKSNSTDDTTIEIPSLNFGDSTKNKLEILIYITRSSNANFWAIAEDNSHCPKVALTKTLAKGYEGESSTEESEPISTEWGMTEENENYGTETTFYKSGTLQTNTNNNTIRIKITAETNASTAELNMAGNYIDMKISLQTDDPELSSDSDAKATTEYTNLSFSLNNNVMTATVSKKSTTAGAIVIPEKVSVSDDDNNVTVYSVTNIGSFSDCTRLTSVYIPSSITTISEWAFKNCTGLTSISIPKSVTSIDPTAFYGCENLESITVDTDNTTYYSFENAIYEKATNNLVVGCKGTTSINDDCTTILKNAFYGAGLTEITIPLKVTSIACSAFHDSSLTFAYFENPFGWHSEYDEDNGGDYGLDYSWTSLAEQSSAAKILKSESYSVFKCEDWDTDYMSGSGTYGYNWNSIWFGVDTEAKTATIKGFIVDNEMHGQIGDLFIPERIVYNNKMYTVTGIAKDAFSTNNETLTAIYLPRTITSLSANAFEGCTGLKAVYLPNSITTIPASAFKGCTNLQTINLPNSITSIGRSAFYGCTSLTSITIPESVISIDAYAFQNSGLTSATFENSTDWAAPANLDLTRATDAARALKTTYYYETWIRALDYTNYTQLSFIFSADTAVGSAIDAQDKKIATGEIEIPNYVKYNNTIYTIKRIASNGFASSGITTITLPNSITNIGDNAFSGCTDLKTIDLPTSITYIGYRSFYGCSGLTSITIPKNVTEIGDKAFKGCDNITIKFDGATSATTPTGTYSSNDWTVGDTLISMTSLSDTSTNKDYLTSTYTNYIWYKGLTYNVTYTAYSGETTPYASVKKSTTSTISGALDISAIETFIYAGTSCSVTTIPASGFASCTALTSIALPDSITTIEESGFKDCSNLISIKFSVNLETIGTSAFKSCEGITSLNNLPDSLTTISENAFKNCSNLTSITIPAKVSDIAVSAFFSTTSLEEITVDSNNDKYASFSNAIYTKSNGNAYYTLAVGCKGTTEINSNNCKTIGSQAFYGCTGLGNITIPASVTLVGASAFQDCTGLTSITFSGTSKLTSIGGSAFQDCTGLTALTIPASVGTIGDKAFKNCAGLTSITFSGTSKLTSIGESAFQDIGLSSITIPSSVTEIGKCGLYNAVQNGGKITFDDYLGWSVNNIYVDLSYSAGNYVKFNNTDNFYSDYTTYKLKKQVYQVAYGISSDYDLYYGGYTVLKFTKTGYTRTYNNETHECLSVEKGENFNDYVQSKGLSNGSTFIIPIKVYKGSTYYWITEIKDEGFSSYSIAGIQMPLTIGNIGAGAFANNTKLTSITILDAVCVIGKNAFKGCSALAKTKNMIHNAWYEKGVENANFIRCNDGNSDSDYGYKIYYTDYDSQWAQHLRDGAEELRSCELSDNDDTDTDIILYTLLNDNTATAKMQNTGITGEITVARWIKFGGIKYTMTQIPNGAFAYAKAIDGITIPSTVTYIANTAFVGCKGLAKMQIVYSDGEEKTSTLRANDYVSYENAIYYSLNSVSLVLSIKTVYYLLIVGGGNCKTIMDETTETSIDTWIKKTIGIETNAFRDRECLTSITIPSSVGYIGHGAFIETGLTNNSLTLKSTTWYHRSDIELGFFGMSYNQTVSYERTASNQKDSNGTYDEYTAKYILITDTVNKDDAIKYMLTPRKTTSNGKEQKYPYILWNDNLPILSYKIYK